MWVNARYINSISSTSSLAKRKQQSSRVEITKAKTTLFAASTVRSIPSDFPGFSQLNMHGFAWMITLMFHGQRLTKMYTKVSNFQTGQIRITFECGMAQILHWGFLIVATSNPNIQAAKHLTRPSCTRECNAVSGIRYCRQQNRLASKSSHLWPDCKTLHITTLSRVTRYMYHMLLLQDRTAWHGLVICNQAPQHTSLHQTRSCHAWTRCCNQAATHFTAPDKAPPCMYQM